MDVRAALLIILLTLPGHEAECPGLRGIGVFVNKLHKEMPRVVAAARANCPTCKKGCRDHCLKDVIEDLDYDMKLLKEEVDKIEASSDCICGRDGDSDSDSDGDGVGGDGSGADSFVRGL